MKLWLGVMLLSIEIHGACSLKDRRQVVHSLIGRLKRHFNASAADLGPEGLWNLAEIGAVCSGSSSHETASRLEEMCLCAERSEEEGEFEILNLQREVHAYGDL
ncbi:MAG: DUF503 domain-containing protein [Synergistaceae bacterium]|jgi:uncharacterized protein YlxP (DUF503 family)|nr:DUF503 domain-containing protein [Synergistaceae bacterium]